MKISKTALAIAAVGVVHLALTERYRHRALALDAERIHQDWIAKVADDPAVTRMWAGDMDPAEYARLVQCNRLISFLSIKYRAGLLSDDALRQNAKRLMETAVGREHWARFGRFRAAESVDRTDHKIHTAFDRAYALHADEHQAAV